MYPIEGLGSSYYRGFRITLLTWRILKRGQGLGPTCHFRFGVVLQGQRFTQRFFFHDDDDLFGLPLRCLSYGWSPSLVGRAREGTGAQPNTECRWKPGTRGNGIASSLSVRGYPRITKLNQSERECTTRRGSVIHTSPMSSLQTTTSEEGDPKTSAGFSRSKKFFPRLPQPQENERQLPQIVGKDEVWRGRLETVNIRRWAGSS